jgi:hypothetical protein
LSFFEPFGYLGIWAMVGVSAKARQIKNMNLGLAVTNKEGFVIGAMSCHDHPYTHIV